MYNIPTAQQYLGGEQDAQSIQFDTGPTGDRALDFYRTLTSQHPGQQGQQGSQFTGMGAIPLVIGEHFQPYRKMLDTPAFLQTLGKGYKQSPGFQFALNQALRGVGQASAAGGMAGSPMHQQQSAEMASGYASQDFNNYLRNALQTYMTGARGYGRAGEDISSSILSQASLAQLREEERAKASEAARGQALGAMGAMAGGMMGL